jgi:hypothetical protein
MLVAVLSEFPLRGWRQRKLRWRRWGRERSFGVWRSAYGVRRMSAPANGRHGDGAKQGKEGISRAKYF